MRQGPGKPGRKVTNGGGKKTIITLELSEIFGKNPNSCSGFGPSGDLGELLMINFEGWFEDQMGSANGSVKGGLRYFLVIATILVGVFVVLPGVPSAYGQDRAEGGHSFLTTPTKARTGTLLFEAQESGQYVEAPRLGTDFDISVSGPTARTQLTQHFVNPTNGWVEAIYVFPLPATAAVDSLKMVMGDRIIVGEIKKRSEAKVIYERAKAQGKKAALVEQHRPNIFSQKVANIGPGESIVIQLEYQQTVLQTSGTFHLRVPLVVAPRYSPKPDLQVVDFRPDGQALVQMRDPVPDRAEISPPVLDPREYPQTNPVTLTVRLNAGFELGDVTSSYHAIDIDAMGDHYRTVTLSKGAVPADRDFELVWRAKSGTMPQIGLFKERVGEDNYVLITVTPPSPSADQKKMEIKTPREVIFVIDNSGSMGGTSLRQAKKSLVFGLERLGPEDRFNIIRFDHTYSVLFSQSRPATYWNVTQGRYFVRSLSASGGTEMVAPMAAALKDDADQNLLRQVVFLTDGAIGNEKQLLKVIGTQRGRSRVFMVGIGSAPNSYLMSCAAEIGRGTFTHIGAMDQVQERMTVLFEKLESPVVTHLSVQFEGGEADVTPGLLPDLYRGEPVLLAAKLRSVGENVKISGLIGERQWNVDLSLTRAVPGKGISKLWARRKIADAEVGLRLRSLTQVQADDRITKLALMHGLVSRLTSLVAVEDAISRPNGVELTRADVPLNLPAGWDFDKVFGPRAGLRLERALMDGGDDLLQDASAADVNKPAQRAIAARYSKIAVSKVARQRVAPTAAISATNAFAARRDRCRPAAFVRVHLLVA